MSALSTAAFCQLPDTINITDKNGKKQGHWIKKNTDGIIQYDGFFKDDNPVGEFKRYYEDGSLKSIMLHLEDNPEVKVKFYHPNGFIAAEGSYINQKKEGLWNFFSQKTENYRICEENYTNDLRNGPSIKFYKDGTIAEKLNFTDDLRHGEWTQYYVTGKLCIKANYESGKLNGSFEVLYANGKPEYMGTYNNDVRDGPWKIFTEEGKLEIELDYKMGRLDDPRVADREKAFFDLFEKNRGKISDPEITGTIWK
ncbi:MAG: hypothetical protein R6W67_02710 [Bacteroidales bacterium]